LGAVVVWRAFCAVAFLMLGSLVSASAGDSLYETLPPRPQSSFGANTSFVFIAPYTTRAETTLTASISKSTASGSSGSQANKAAPPSILYAAWKDTNGGQITFSVSCDLRSVLSAGDKVTVTGTQPDPDYKVSDAEVVGVTSAQVTVKRPAAAPPRMYISGGTFSNVGCPSQADTFTVALTVTPTPISRGYLYLRRNAFFDDSVNFSVGVDGMPSNSDTSSTQEITAILTELAQTAAAVVGAGGGGGILNLGGGIANQLAEKKEIGVLPPTEQPTPKDPQPPPAADQETIDKLKKDTPQQAADMIAALPPAQLAHLLEETSTADLVIILNKLPLRDFIIKLGPVDFAYIISELSLPPKTELTDVLKKWNLAELARYMQPADVGQFLLSLWPKSLAEVLQEAPLDSVIAKVPSTDLAGALKRLDPKDDLVVFLKKAPLTELIRKLSSVDLFELLNSLTGDNFNVVLTNLPPSELVKKLTSSQLNLLLIRAPQAIQDAMQEEIDRQAQQNAQEDLNRNKRDVCYKAVASFVSAAPFTGTVGFEQIVTRSLEATPPSRARIDAPRATGRWAPSDATIEWVIPLVSNPGVDDDTGDKVAIRFLLRTRMDSYGQEGATGAKATARSGFVAFFPVSATATTECLILRHVADLPKGRRDLPATVLLSAPTVVNLYTESHLLDPQRDFFTNPHDTFTFTAGLITGHKFTGQSAAKTVVDTITSPIRALMPSVTVTQSVAVSPTGKTTTTSTQTAPPKGP